MPDAKRGEEGSKKSFEKMWWDVGSVGSTKAKATAQHVIDIRLSPGSSGGGFGEGRGLVEVAGGG